MSFPLNLWSEKCIFRACGAILNPGWHYGQFISHRNSKYFFGFRSGSRNIDNGITLPIERTNDRRCESSPTPVYIQETNRNTIRKTFMWVCMVSLALVVPGKRETMQRIRCVVFLLSILGKGPRVFVLFGQIFQLLVIFSIK